MAALKNGLYVREVGPFPLSRFSQTPGSYTIEGHYLNVVRVRKARDDEYDGDGSAILCTVMMDPRVEQTHQIKMQAHEELLEAQAKGLINHGVKVSPYELTDPAPMGAEIITMRIGDKIPLDMNMDQAQYIGQCDDLVFFTITQDRKPILGGIFG